MKKWGLALGAGGILGFAHIGVIQVMEEYGLKPAFISGSSAGAIVAALYSVGFKPRRIQNEVTKMAARNDLWDPVPADEKVSAMGISGIIGGKVIEGIFDVMLKGKSLKSASMPLSICSVDLISGEIVVFTNEKPISDARVLPGRVYLDDCKISEAVRASISIPGIFVPKKIGGFHLVDGGVKDMVPAYEARRMGAEEVIAVDLGVHAERPEYATNLLSVVMRSFALASRETVVEQLKAHASLVLQPRVEDLGFPTPDKINKLIQEGRRCALENMGRWKSIVS